MAKPPRESASQELESKEPDGAKPSTAASGASCSEPGKHEQILAHAATRDAVSVGGEVLLSVTRNKDKYDNHRAEIVALHKGFFKECHSNK